MLRILKKSPFVFVFLIAALFPFIFGFFNLYYHNNNAKVLKKMLEECTQITFEVEAHSEDIIISNGSNLNRTEQIKNAIKSFCSCLFLAGEYGVKYNYTEKYNLLDGNFKLHFRENTGVYTESNKDNCSAHLKRQLKQKFEK